MPSEVTKKQRSFYEDRARRQFIKYLAYTNFFDKVLTDAEIETAKKGYLPEDLDIHHIFPISGTSSEDVSSFTNMAILHKNTHKAINKHIFDTQLSVLLNQPNYSQTDIWLPQFDPVDADRIIAIRSGDTRLPADIRYGVQMLNAKYGFENTGKQKKIVQPTPKEMVFIQGNLKARF